MTLILKLDLDMVKMYLYTKNEVSMWRGWKVIAWTGIHTEKMDRLTYKQTDGETDRHDWKHYLPAYAGGNKNIATNIAPVRIELKSNNPTVL